MKKLALTICLFLVAILASFNLSAQKSVKDSGYNKGTFLINGGISLVNVHSGYYYNDVTFPALTANAEYSFHPWIGVGPYVGFRGYSNGSTFALGARGTFHYAQFIPAINTKKLDLYGTVHLGPTFTRRDWDNSFKYFGYDRTYTGFTVGPVAGARYFFTGGGFGAYGEVGYGPLGFLTIGLSGKF